MFVALAEDGRADAVGSLVILEAGDEALEDVGVEIGLVGELEEVRGVLESVLDGGEDVDELVFVGLGCVFAEASGDEVAGAVRADVGFPDLGEAARDLAGVEQLVDDVGERWRELDLGFVVIPRDAVRAGVCDQLPTPSAVVGDRGGSIL